MALERIDPITLEDCYAVDHLLRYSLAAPFTKGKRVLDAACGLGFGSVLLLHQEAAEVVGLDNAAEAIRLCQDRWKMDQLTFQQMDLEDLGSSELGSFGLITSFETLEHVKDPPRVLEQFKSVLEPGGLLFGSVPGRTDRHEDNAYHLHHFTADSLEELLRSQFSQVLLYRQDFSIKSGLSVLDRPAPSLPLNKKEDHNLEIDFGTASREEDTLVFLASDAELSALPLHHTASSRGAWLRMRSAYLKSLAELHSFTSKYRQLFLEHGDLQIKFTNMLGWGQWHYEELHGRKPDASVMEQLQNTASQREEKLRQQVADLQAEVRQLKAYLARAEELLEPVQDSLQEAFERGARSQQSTGQDETRC